MIEKTNRCRYINDLGWECCSLLNVEECPENCKFRKTEEEYQEGQTFPVEGEGQSTVKNVYEKSDWNR